MTRQISVAEARNGFTRVLRAVERGQIVEVTRRGKTVAVLLSARQWKRRRNFYEALQEWRKKYDVEKLGIGPEIWDGVRDPSPGRDVSF